ncbi:ABC transporter ATP-binding protein [Pelotomaculum propionicicum]|uniref:Taurine import ATP-binding protein TauB n=1 Tax=Pelotomaculum propionicicum TaxID=258475 RepID=A0A4Y7RM27_9FIRM|nr:ABC transporter ATP-binding protein [Pelotomaculum propionicicum]TEB09876.1 Taurine import ATP-binding protein TauB [Pelotomaculum propionicicum]
MLKIEDLEVTYKNKISFLALQGVSFTLEEGHTCAIIGPSGCGKSTLLYVLAGLLEHSGGQVLINGETVRPKRRETALILQDYGLLPWKTAQENTSLGLEIRGVPSEEKRALVEEAMQELGIWEFRDNYPAQLSGGQRQRVAIARSLTLKPDLFLMDEPFSSLDALTREGLQNTLLEFWQKRRASMVLVTHNIEEAVFLGQRILIFSGSPGRILHVIENKEMGEQGYRNQQLFYQRCSRVREVIEKGV